MYNKGKYKVNVSGISPVVLPDMSSCNLSAYLQEEYPEFFKNAFGASDTDSSLSPGQHYNHIRRSDSSNSCNIPSDGYRYKDRSDTSGSYYLLCGEQTPNRSPSTSKKTKGKSEYSFKELSPCRKFTKVVPLNITKIIEIALKDLGMKLDVWLDKLKFNILNYAECLAKSHHEQKLAQKVIRSWYSLAQNKCKERTEKTCNEKMQDVCKKLSSCYESKIKTLKEEIETLNSRLGHMQEEQEQYARNVKTAFMRGICALNNETMPAFTLQTAQISPLRKMEPKLNLDNIKTTKSDPPLTRDQLLQNLPADLIISEVPECLTACCLGSASTSHEDKSKPAKEKSSPSLSPSPSMAKTGKYCSSSSPSSCYTTPNTRKYGTSTSPNLSPNAKAENKTAIKKSTAGSTKKTKPKPCFLSPSKKSPPAYKIYETH